MEEGLTFGKKRKQEKKHALNKSRGERAGENGKSEECIIPETGSGREMTNRSSGVSRHRCGMMYVGAIFRLACSSRRDVRGKKKLSRTVSGSSVSCPEVRTGVLFDGKQTMGGGGPRFFCSCNPRSPITSGRHLLLSLPPSPFSTLLCPLPLRRRSDGADKSSLRPNYAPGTATSLRRKAQQS
ncbi:hypothetical protein PR048_025384 [Dryococelus australis]|uniref:Uncharacterized protein n=1 Tax=Dryococelus australis TaxID=614101 RepID=A0ABQ9GR94_9NEOP|nr:hypothetical protein PR048_025384 [Dryococelus australis]